MAETFLNMEGAAVDEAGADETGKVNLGCAFTLKAKGVEEVATVVFDGENAANTDVEGGDEKLAGVDAEVEGLVVTIAAAPLGAAVAASIVATAAATVAAASMFAT